jgi:small conductance mechanosensitive channel
MQNPWKERRERALRPMFETRSDAWAAVGLDMQVNQRELRNSRRRLAVEIPALIATIIGRSLAINHWTQVHDSPHRGGAHHFWLVNSKAPFELLAVIIVLALGWLISKDLSRMAPSLFRRMDPATAGTVEFIIRLIAVAATILGAVNIAGVSAQVVAVGGAFTAVVVGLAAQPVLGNLFAGLVLLSAQPFRLGDRIRLYAGAIGNQEGTVSSQGLLYTSLTRGANRIMIPNSLVLAAVVVPIREPAPVDVRVKLNAGVRPSQAQAILDSELGHDTLYKPSVVLEEIDGDDVYIRVQATPESSDESSRLADEIITVLARVTGQHQTISDGRPDRQP